MGLALYSFFAERAEIFAKRSRAAASGGPPTLEHTLEQENASRPYDRVLWAHFADVGKIAQTIQFLSRLLQQEEDLSVVLTTAEAIDLSDILPPRTTHLRAPADTGPTIRRFLDFWKPDAVVLVGRSLHPLMLKYCDMRSIPVLFVEAQFSRRAYRFWRAFPGTTRKLLNQFRAILTGSEADHDTLIRMGAEPDKIEIPGFLEEGTAALPCNEAERDSLGDLLAGRPVWLAASVQASEIQAIIAAHSLASRGSHRLLLILVPADMSQGPAIAAQFQQSGWSSRYRSDDEEPEEDVQVYIADTDGEMGLWYRLAPITFVGSTLIEAGTCPDPYEPAALGSAILYGPHTGLRESVFDRISAAGAARRVGSAAALGEAVSELLSPDKAAEMAHKAWQVTSRGAEVTDRVIELLQDALDESPN